MSKFTPGPWVASVTYNDGGWEDRYQQINISAGAILIASYRTTYVEYPEGDDENAANARLIAAAPEMADELRNIAEAVLLNFADDQEFREWAQNRCRSLLASINGDK